MSEILVLDVGHGNAAVVRDRATVTVIDAGQGSTLLETLELLRVDNIHTLIVSHADADHLGGAIQLLCQPGLKIGQVLVNGDPRRSGAWQDFKRALADARQRGTVRHALTVDENDRLPSGELEVTILHPSAVTELSTVQGVDLHGRALTSNSLSGVVKVSRGGRGLVLFPGDLDRGGLERLKAEGAPLHAEHLVFPHHGGRPGGGEDPARFASELTALVRPSRVLFSIGRGTHENPRPEVVAGVLAAAPEVHIACTQLSKRCAQLTPTSPPSHLVDLPSRGRGSVPPRDSHSCCLGSMKVSMENDGERSFPSRDEHLSFVRQAAPSALCLRSVP